MICWHLFSFGGDTAGSEDFFMKCLMRIINMNKQKLDRDYLQKVTALEYLNICKIASTVMFVEFLKKDMKAFELAHNSVNELQKKCLENDPTTAYNQGLTYFIQKMDVIDPRERIDYFNQIELKHVAKTLGLEYATN